MLNNFYEKCSSKESGSISTVALDKHFPNKQMNWFIFLLKQANSSSIQIGPKYWISYLKCHSLKVCHSNIQEIVLDHIQKRRHHESGWVQRLSNDFTIHKLCKHSDASLLQHNYPQWGQKFGQLRKEHSRWWEIHIALSGSWEANKEKVDSNLEGQKQKQKQLQKVVIWWADSAFCKTENKFH